MPDLTVVVERDPLVESVHPVSAVIVEADGTIVAQAGDPHFVTYWRSCAKPFQLFPLVTDGGVERFALDGSMLALACASHNAESMHRELGARWLAAIGATEADLSCGGHPSLWPALADAMVHDDIVPTPLWSNCSGKHAALLALARLHGWGTFGYQERTHPVQQRVAESVAHWANLSLDEMHWGVDGCTAAAVALSLRHMAQAYARFGVTTDPAMRQIRDAMMAHPYVVAGTDRLDTVLMQAWPGRIIAKIGAEGVYSAALPTLGLGIALKAHDGDMRSAMLVLLSILEAVTARRAPGESWPVEMLAEWRHPAIRNTRGAVTGHWDVRGELMWA